MNVPNVQQLIIYIIFNYNYNARSFRKVWGKVIFLHLKCRNVGYCIKLQY